MTALESDFRHPDRKSFVKIFTLHVRFCKSLCYNPVFDTFKKAKVLQVA